ncbi:hypothetical protein XI03_02780 [Bradyrhizobium sp. CCBAU 65884]|nr:hypothetical protein [Bradyrhizobium sp. CCBAU 65884]
MLASLLYIWDIELLRALVRQQRICDRGSLAVELSKYFARCAHRSKPKRVYGIIGRQVMHF